MQTVYFLKEAHDPLAADPSAQQAAELEARMINGDFDTMSEMALGAGDGDDDDDDDEIRR